MSPSPDDKAELGRLAELIDRIVQVQHPDRSMPEKDVRAKIDLLERAIEAWRIRHRHLVNELAVEEFVQAQMFVDENNVRFQLPDRLENLGAGTPPARLQPRLLLFLLLYHRSAYAVYDIIDKFIRKVWDELETLDFKKTKTGVTRCFTNTRFAAHILRDYGLLKFTDKEAYKTWVLSLPGFLVASKVLQAGVEWRLSIVDPSRISDLHPDIQLAWDGLQTFDKFVERLAYICRPNTEVFSTFQRVLEAAYRCLPGYWLALQNHDLSQKDRKAETTRRLAELDQLPGMDDFYRQFSACVNVERLLRQVDGTAL